MALCRDENQSRETWCGIYEVLARGKGGSAIRPGYYDGFGYCFVASISVRSLAAFGGHSNYASIRNKDSYLGTLYVRLGRSRTPSSSKPCTHWTLGESDASCKSDTASTMIAARNISIYFVGHN